MEPYRTDEEQVEALQRWWNENGRSTVVMIALALAAYFSYFAWQDHRDAQIQAASGLYQQVLDLHKTATDKPLEEAQVATQSHIAQQLKDEFATSTYASYAAFLLAKQAVVAEQDDAAVIELEWVLANSDEAEVLELATLRLAKVKFNQRDDEAAKALLESLTPAIYASAFEELKGDIAFDAKDTAAAEMHYKKAMEIGPESLQQTNRLLQIKLDSLTPVDETLLIDKP